MSQEILTVTQLNQAVRLLLEGQFPQAFVEGEISNLSRPASGHLYFSLKDKNAQVRCAMFRLKSGWLGFEPANGLQVRVLAKVSLYPDRGDYQLIVSQMEAIGDGALRRAYEILVQKLAGLGLFQEKWKKKLPTLPQHIGVITSPTGAAIRDILSVLKRRFPSIPVSIYPTLVQGREASEAIAQAIKLANQHSLCDVLIVARGGGSLEDLWPFNEERVANAIFESKIPIISGVGHETDFTISDLVADLRAPTPSAAAELVTPNQLALLEQFRVFENRLIQLIEQSLSYRAQQLDWLLKRLRHPGQIIQVQLQQFRRLETSIVSAIKRILQDKARQLSNAVRMLETISPLSTLSRGYAIVSRVDTNEVILSATAVQKGVELSIQLNKGMLRCEVISSV